MNGVDHVEPHPVIPELARRLTGALGAPRAAIRRCPLRRRGADGRERATASASRSKSIRGELRAGEDYANLLPGVFSARVYLKQANARVQTLLEKHAEPLATFASMLGARYPAGELRYAWKTLLQNHPHDSICGCSIDAVHEENMTRFARAGQVARAVVDEAAMAIARQVPAAAPGVLRLVALQHRRRSRSAARSKRRSTCPMRTANQGGMWTNGALDAPVAFWPKGTRPVSIASTDGRGSPLQVLGAKATC